MGYGRGAWHIYEELRSGELGFEEAKRRLEKLLQKARVAAKA